MLEVQKIALNRAITTITALNAQFKIILPDGQEFGELVVVPPKIGRRAPSKFPAGELTEHFRHTLESLEPGQAAMIPFGKYEADDDLNRLRSCLSGWCCTHWGSGSAITSTNRDLKVVEVLRLS